MGYRTDLADRMRRTQLKVVEIADWRTRGSATFAPVGSVDHDTVGARTGNIPSLGIIINGRSDLAGPLYEVVVARDLTVYVVAAGRANHAGTGGWRGLAGNSTVWGVALENVGTDDEPITGAQWDALARVHAELARGAYDVRNVCQHFEWAPTRKVDAWRADPAGFRSRVQHYLDHPPGSEPEPAKPQPPMEDDDMGFLAQATHDGPGPNPNPVWWVAGPGRAYIGTGATIDALRFGAQVPSEIIQWPQEAIDGVARLDVDLAELAARVAVAVVAKLSPVHADVDAPALAEAVVAEIRAAHLALS